MESFHDFKCKTLSQKIIWADLRQWDWVSGSWFKKWSTSSTTYV